ncbi:hypothetical protein MtrunA17_Chr6g0464061 [Medicago truncatula]|uniref:Uncharacterized protein n=1 Tax=Medicago truncatula TaxID=3880 RepID=A0A396HCT0_MEDTR|nr:hypothetical protein MtrunA17_Chr6g0464061 [Medicago truncatula]
MEIVYTIDKTRRNSQSIRKTSKENKTPKPTYIKKSNFIASNKDC